jgi:signal transduction histidine kinase
MEEKRIAAMGPLPRTHGMLGAMLEAPAPHRTQDIQADPRFKGWWPDEHPDMHSFLGVPIVAADEVIGAFYLTDKEGAPQFDGQDEELIRLLAAHAAIAITNARLYEHSRELSVLSERNRLALELHDVVSQKLFSVVLTAEAAATVLDRDPAAARVQIARVQTLAREALDELRDLIEELRPPDLARDGLCGTLRKHVAMLERLHGIPIDVDVDDRAEPNAPRDREVLRVAQEALHNAVRHADATRLTLRLAAADGRLVLEVVDDGRGFDPADPELRSRRLGLTSMEERARRLGGRVDIRSAAGTGTVVRLEVDSG